MARKPRIDYPGAWHHVMHEADRKVPVFNKDAHCDLFLDTLDDIAYTFELEVHAYCLTGNRYHLLMRSIHGNLSMAMKQLGSDLTHHFNALQKMEGVVFPGRFRSQLVEDQSNLPYVMAYIHLNPLRTGVVNRLLSRCASSHRAYLGRDAVPEFLSTKYFETIFSNTNELGEFVRDLHRENIQWPDKMSMEKGWLKQKGKPLPKRRSKVTDTRFITPKQALAEAREITGATMKRLRQVVYGPRANPERRFAVWVLKERTQLNYRQIGEIIEMTDGQVGHVIRRMSSEEEPFKTWFAKWKYPQRVVTSTQ